MEVTEENHEIGCDRILSNSLLPHNDSLRSVFTLLTLNKGQFKKY
jgi:hypothetical protein